jgi:AcrR family transcriptional regulator
MAEVCAECGYANASVASVAKRAGVSSVTFYRQFADKLDCMLAAHGQLLERLLEGVDRAREAASGEGAKSRAAIHTALALFAADAPSARLLTVEILAVGPEGAERHDAMVEAFARRLRADVTSDGDEMRLPNADWVRVAGMLALVGRLVVAAEAARLPELEGELVATVLPQS